MVLEKRTWLLGVAVLVALIGLVGLLSNLAAAQEPGDALPELGASGTSGAISGVITDKSSGTPLTATVKVYDAVSFALIGQTTAGADGAYSLTVTAPYSQARVYAGQSGYVPQWYPAAPFFSQAEPIALQGTLVPNIDIALSTGGAISVTFLEDDGVTPAMGASVSLYDGQVKRFLKECNSSGLQPCMSSLPAGTYKLYFNNPMFYISEWYEDRVSWAQATAITVAEGAPPVSVTARLSRRGTISTTVTDALSGEGLWGIYVIAYDQEGQYKNQVNGPGPFYQLALEPGRYRVRYFDQQGRYTPEYYDDASSWEAAEWITVEANTTISLYASLMPAQGLITGTITKDGGVPLATGESASIYLERTDPLRTERYYQYFYGDGIQITYAMTIPEGIYQANFSGVMGLDAFSQWYNNKPEQSQADPITVTAGQPVTNINVDLITRPPSYYGCITGTVTSRGQPVSGDVYVQVYKYANMKYDTYSGRGDYRIEPEENGVYQVCNLYPGDYLVSFSQFPSATTWYNHALNSLDAVPVSVGTGQVVSNVNGTLDELGACISGRLVPDPALNFSASFRILDASGLPVYFWVGNYGASFGGSGSADWDGHFVACGLSAGTYTIRRIGTFPTVYDSDPITVGVGEHKDIGDVIRKMRVYLPVVLSSFSQP